MATEKGEGLDHTRPKIKVLIADDDTPTRMLLKAAIVQWGYDIIEAKDGEEAWHILEEDDPPRLLLLDWLMPKMDGITLCQYSREKLNFHPYIILLTQLTGVSNLIKGLEAGADEFLSKPFNMPELRSRLAIGSRIIKYDIALAQCNAQIKMYDSQLTQLKNNISNILQQANHIEKSPSMTQVEKITKLQRLLQEMAMTIHELKENDGKIKDKNEHYQPS